LKWILVFFANVFANYFLFFMDAQRHRGAGHGAGAEVICPVWPWLDDDGSAPSAPSAANRSVEGLVDVMQDAVERCTAPLDADRLWRWQSALFPGGTSGMAHIAVGRWRDHADPMQTPCRPLVQAGGGNRTHRSAGAVCVLLFS